MATSTRTHSEEILGSCAKYHTACSVSSQDMGHKQCDYVSDTDMCLLYFI